MKKIYLLFAAIGAFLAVSCNEELRIDVEPVQAGRKVVTLSATIEDGTKTTYAGGTTFSWTSGDKISVLTSKTVDAVTTYKFEEFTANSTGSTSTFTGTIDEGFALSNYALFPASASHSYSGSNLYFDIPKTKDCTGTFSADLPMVGKKNDGVYNFTHCSGAAKITVNNIPAKYTAVTFAFTSGGVKMSGAFSTFGDGAGHYKWNPDNAADATEKGYTRKVSVSNGSATVYVPYGIDGTIWSGSSLSVTGHDGVNDDVLYSNASLKAIGPFSRATVIPLTPLNINRLKYIDWTDSGVSTFSKGDYNYRMEEWKATSDSYYVYFRFQLAAWKIPADPSGTYFYTGYNTNGVAGDGVAPVWPTNLEIEPDIEALTLLYPFVSSDGTTIVFKDGVDNDGFIRCPADTDTGKLTTTGSQPGTLAEGQYVYVAFSVPRSKIGSPSGTITVQHKGLDGYLSSPGTFTLN